MELNRGDHFLVSFITLVDENFYSKLATPIIWLGTWSSDAGGGLQSKDSKSTMENSRKSSCTYQIVQLKQILG